MMAAPRGLSIFELVVVVALLTMLVLIASSEVRTAMRSSSATSIGAIELILATRAAETFRNDVRSAQGVTVGQEGSTVQLRTSAGEIGYSLDRDGMLRRTAAGSGAATDPAALAASPRMCALYFGLDTPVAGRSCLRFLRARWVCAGGALPGDEAGKPTALPGRTLVLDTALRVAEEKGARKP